MSRYYSVEIGAETAAQATGPASQTAAAKFTNQLPNGTWDPGAWQVELDVQAAPFASPTGDSWVRVTGPSLQQMQQASNFNNAPIVVRGGMQKGLPLATSQAGQAGILVSGYVFQAFGNWMAGVQTLDFVIAADGGATQAKPANLVVCWSKGQPLSVALKSALQAAYPGVAATISMSPQLVQGDDSFHQCQTVQQLANWLKGKTQALLGGDYPGVDLTFVNGQFYAFDGTAAPQSTTAIAFQDLMGQPTWLDAFTLQFSTVMRADIVVGSAVTLPQAAEILALTTQQSQSQAKNKSTFTGTFTVAYARHVGNSRGPNGADWASVFQANVAGAPQSTTGTGATAS